MRTRIYLQANLGVRWWSLACDVLLHFSSLTVIRERPGFYTQLHRWKLSSLQDTHSVKLISQIVKCGSHLEESRYEVQVNIINKLWRQTRKGACESESCYKQISLRLLLSSQCRQWLGRILFFDLHLRLSQADIDGGLYISSPTRIVTICRRWILLRQEFLSFRNCSILFYSP